MKQLPSAASDDFITFSRSTSDAMQLADGFATTSELSSSFDLCQWCGVAVADRQSDRVARNSLLLSLLSVIPRATDAPLAHLPRHTTPPNTSIWAPGRPALGSELPEAFSLSFGPRRPSFPKPCRAFVVVDPGAAPETEHGWETEQNEMR